MAIMPFDLARRVFNVRLRVATSVAIHTELFLLLFGLRHVGSVAIEGHSGSVRRHAQLSQRHDCIVTIVGGSR